MRTTSIAILGLIALGAVAGCGGASGGEGAASPATYGSRPPPHAMARSDVEKSIHARDSSVHFSDESQDTRVPVAAATSGHAPLAGFAAHKAKTPATGSAPTPPAPSPPEGDNRGAPGARGEAPADPSIAKDAPHETSMLIYTAHVTMAVYQVEPGLANVENIARDLGGYLATRGDTEITVRIPRARFDEALRRVGLSGDVLHKELSAEDVTDAFVDLEVRLKNARNMRDRLAELLKRADVKAALEIEKELGRITGEIEQMEGKLKVLRDRIAYSTITVTFQGRGAGALRDMPLRLPFPWLSELGLPRLLSLHE
jgi:hypothetical protein